MSLPEYLLQEGFMPFRKLFIDGNWIYEPCEFNNDYSSLVNGKLDYRFIKDGKEIIWGLNERHKPPTLVYPRPKGVNTDDEMNKILLDNDSETIYNMICVG